MNFTALGVDVDKNYSHLAGTNLAGKPLIKQKFNRQNLSEFVTRCPPCPSGMDTCPGSQRLARKSEEDRHQVKL